MQLSSRHRRIRKISLTPLIDVVFLLLVFFMLSSTFLKYVQVPVGGASKGAAQKLNKDELMIVDVAADGTVTINGETVPLEELTEKLNELEKTGKVRAVIKSIPGLKTQHILNVLHHAKRSNLKNVILTR